MKRFWSKIQLVGLFVFLILIVAVGYNFQRSLAPEDSSAASTGNGIELVYVTPTNGNPQVGQTFKVGVIADINENVSVSGAEIIINYNSLFLTANSVSVESQFLSPGSNIDNNSGVISFDVAKIGAQEVFDGEKFAEITFHYTSQPPTQLQIAVMDTSTMGGIGGSGFIDYITPGGYGTLDYGPVPSSSSNSSVSVPSSSSSSASNTAQTGLSLEYVNLPGSRPVVGQEIEVAVIADIFSGTNVTGGEVRISYDTSYMSGLSLSVNSAFLSPSSTINHSTGRVEFDFAKIGGSSISNGEQIATIRFKYDNPSPATSRFLVLSNSTLGGLVNGNFSNFIVPAGYGFLNYGPDAASSSSSSQSQSSASSSASSGTTNPPPANNSSSSSSTNYTVSTPTPNNPPPNNPPPVANSSSSSTTFYVPPPGGNNPPAVNPPTSNPPPVVTPSANNSSAGSSSSFSNSSGFTNSTSSSLSSFSSSVSFSSNSSFSSASSFSNNSSLSSSTQSSGTGFTPFDFNNNDGEGDVQGANNPFTNFLLSIGLDPAIIFIILVALAGLAGIILVFFILKWRNEARYQQDPF